jgi:hypothetical protein
MIEKPRTISPSHSIVTARREWLAVVVREPEKSVPNERFHHRLRANGVEQSKRRGENN